MPLDGFFFFISWPKAYRGTSGDEWLYLNIRRIQAGRTSNSPFGTEPLSDVPIIRRSRPFGKPFWILLGGGLHTFPLSHCSHQSATKVYSRHLTAFLGVFLHLFVTIRTLYSVYDSFLLHVFFLILDICL